MVPLADLLRRAGVLPSGDVVAVETTPAGAFNSATDFVRVRYRGAPAGAPTALVVKRPSPAAWSRRAAVEEATFYRYVRQHADHPPVLPRCFAAEDGYLVLEDLTATHAAPVSRDDLLAGRGLPALEPVDAAVDVLAALHRWWWGRTDWPGPPDWPAYVARRRAAWPRVRADWPDGARPIYESLVDGLDRLWDNHLRRRMAGPLTLVHGDTYLSNFLLPRDGRGRGYLLDWQSPEIDLGAYDLANLCAPFWTRAQRAVAEERVLRRYHEALGVPGYSYEDLLADYRLALAYWVLVPVQDAADGSPRRYWEPKLRCLLDAYTDHHVGELLA